jgi:hypothetical protein
MKRIVTTSLAVSAFIALAACNMAGGGAEAAKLVPDGAKMIAGINVKALMTSKLYTDNKAMIEQDEDAKEALAAMKECNLDPEKLESAVIGADDKEHFVAVISGEGIGVEANLKCIGDKVKEKTGKEPFVIEDKDGKKVLNMDGGEAFGHLVSDKMLAVAHKDWDAQLLERIDGKGTAAVDGSLKDWYGKAPKDKHVWFAASSPAAAGAGDLGPAAEAKGVWGGLDLGDGLAIEVAAAFENAEKATSVAAEAQKGFDEVKGMAGMIGVPQTVVDSVKIEAKDTDLSVTARATKEELDQISNTLKQMVG